MSWFQWHEGPSSVKDFVLGFRETGASLSIGNGDDTQGVGSFTPIDTDGILHLYNSPIRDSASGRLCAYCIHIYLNLLLFIMVQNFLLKDQRKLHYTLKFLKLLLV